MAEGFHLPSLGWAVGQQGLEKLALMSVFAPPGLTFPFVHDMEELRGRAAKQSWTRVKYRKQDPGSPTPAQFPRLCGSRLPEPIGKMGLNSKAPEYSTSVRAGRAGSVCLKCVCVWGPSDFCSPLLQAIPSYSSFFFQPDKLWVSRNVGVTHCLYRDGRHIPHWMS